MPYDIICAEFVQWASSYDGPKFHAVLSDPPYGLKFMGKDWDVVSAEAWGKAMLPLLHPGAIVFMFGGTRTWHKLATGMEDAGFQMWDTLMWLYGQGFPKGQQVGIEGYKTPALKPAWEPILAFRAPASGTLVGTFQQFGAGALHIDGARIPVVGETIHVPQSDPARRSGEVGTDLGISRADKEKFQASQRASIEKANSLGRYPANLILDEESGEMLDGQTGALGKSTGGRANQTTSDKYGDYANRVEKRDPGFGDSGGASRFFYCAKASSSERSGGLESRNTHPTVKPVALTKWLATLLLPPDSVKPRRLLVPFAGSGSEVIGALQAGWDEVVAIEQEQSYCDVAAARVEYTTVVGAPA